jgi:hypothetical protein
MNLVRLIAKEMKRINVFSVKKRIKYTIIIQQSMMNTYNPNISKKSESSPGGG